MFPAARLHLKKLILWAAPLAGLACGGDGGTNIVLPALSITTATSGVEIDPDGYSVSIDGQAGQPMASNATLTVERLAEGQHTVDLADLAPNCSALDNPRTVTVSTGVTATAAFAVTCGASSGTIAVTTTTSGTGSDPDGFSLTLDGADRGSIGVNATANLAGITTGAHLVGLTGLAANCQISDDNPRSVTVTPGQAAEVSFAVICASPAPNSGTLQITTTTGGANLDPDGYSVSVEGAAASQPIAVNATLSIVNVSVGPHAVQLLGLATNCTVAGANPRQATVPAGGTVTMAFEITCVPPPAGTGRVQITTATTGSSIDQDGYMVTLDGGNAQAITVNGARTFDNLAPGPHSVQLSGVAAECSVTGDNPRTVAVTAGLTATVAYAITCATPQPGTGSARITAVTTGSALDPDGYTVTVEGSTGQSLGINGSVTVGSLTVGSHSVQLSGVAANCTVAGSNPRAVTIVAGQTATVAFTITCAAPQPGTGSASITAATTGSSLDPDGYTVTVEGSTAQSLGINGSVTVASLTVGPHSVQLSGVAANCTIAGNNPRTVTIAAGQTATVAFAITCVATGSSVNLSIAGMYLTQSTQTLDGTVPLVAGRDGFLRIFVVANESNNTATPTVQVRFRNGSSTTTQTINAPGGSTPNTVQEGTLGSSWNLPVDAARIQAGLSIEATVDPGNSIPESNENDNGSTKAMTVRTVPMARIRFVSVQQGSSAAGNVSNPDQLMALARRMHPLDDVDTDVHSSVFTASAPLLADGSGWDQLLGDIDALRVDEGTNRTYFGVVKLPYSRTEGLVGLAFQGVPSAVGWDDATDAGRVVAHELGHTWNQLHTPCGNPPNVDGGYPHGNGIGVYGFDVTAGTLKAPSLPDIMGYCTNPWISDYTYRRVMTFRQSSAVQAGVSAVPQPSLLIWGRIENGRPVLEPAVQIVTRPSLPTRPGPYSVTGTADDGSQLFSLSFDAPIAADNPQGSRHFAFAVPVDQARVSRLASVQLVGGGGVATNSRTTALLQAQGGDDSIVAQRDGQSVALRWNARAYPLIVVRDRDTGEVLTFGRGGNARVWTSKGEIDLDVSDGVKSQRVRVAINRS